MEVMEIGGRNHSWLRELDSIHKTQHRSRSSALPIPACTDLLTHFGRAWQGGITDAKCVGSFNTANGTLNCTMVLKSCAQPRVMLTRG